MARAALDGLAQQGPRAFSARGIAARVRRTLGGRRRAQVVILFACVLGLDTASLTSIGAVARPLRLELHLTNTELGILAAAPALVAAAITLPFGMLADRVPRRPVLAATVALWAVAMAGAAAADSFGTLLLLRLFLGAVTAASGPLVASLIGDLFDPAERGRIYGFVVSGELLGTLVGLLVAGNLAAISWRLALGALALPCVALAVIIARTLPEPERGGRGRLPAREGARRDQACALPPRSRRAAARPIERQVLKTDPARMPTAGAIVYVLRIVTNDVLIAASSLGYFFQAGINTFGVVFLTAQFGLGQSSASSLLAVVASGALAGTIAGGRLADRLLAGGRPSARMAVGAAGFLISTAIFVPGLLTGSLAVALPLYFLAGFFLAVPNAPLDAARLDIVPGTLRGRAEAVRTGLRTLAVAAAPLAFGYIADELGSGARTSTHGVAYAVSADGLKYTFLLMLLPMALSGGILLAARGRYVRDEATAAASELAIRDRRSARPEPPRSRGACP